MSLFGSVTASAQLAARRLRVRSALNPMLWLTGIGTPLCFGAAFLFRANTSLSAGLLTIGALPIVVTCAGFAYFAIKQPEKLQSEDYQLRHEAIQLIQTKGGQVAVDITSLEAIANPAQPPATEAN